jgi:2-polyprenyl-6-methoxyphenol hydroxylase-like FAD-dependent oxidoreductase
MKSTVTDVDVKGTTLTVEGGDNAGTHSYDLIIGADGAGSIVRKCMAEKIPDFIAERFTGHHVIKNIYLDNTEAVKKYCHPHYGYGRSMIGYLTVFAMLKSEGNQTAIGIVHVDGYEVTKSIAETRAFFKKIDPTGALNEMMTDNSVENFMNQKARNIHKAVTCNRYYNGDNVVLVGDAAHPFRPIGQGINLAMLGGKLIC